MNLTEEELLNNWNKLMECIATEFSDKERQDKLVEMYNHLQDRMMYAPASSKEHFHNCFIGGYVDHVLRVIESADETHKLWERMGSDMSGYTREELIFCALNHDLGKIGDMDGAAYVPNPSDWHRKNQGSLYIPNPETPFSMVPDRGLFLLNQFGIKYSFNEYLGIKLHDGMYDDSNKPYFVSYNPSSRLQINLPYVLHHADMMASRIEYETWKKDNHKTLPSTKQNNRIISDVKKTINTDKIFKDLFGDNQ
jgi:hypothetical protein